MKTFYLLLQIYLMDFFYSGSTNIAENYNVEDDKHDKHDDDCAILKRNSDQRNTSVPHNFELSNENSILIKLLQ